MRELGIASRRRSAGAQRAGADRGVRAGRRPLLAHRHGAGRAAGGAGPAAPVLERRDDLRSRPARARSLEAGAGAAGRGAGGTGGARGLPLPHADAEGPLRRLRDRVAPDDPATAHSSTARRSWRPACELLAQRPRPDRADPALGPGRIRAPPTRRSRASWACRSRQLAALGADLELGRLRSLARTAKRSSCPSTANACASGSGPRRSRPRRRSRGSAR